MHHNIVTVLRISERFEERERALHLPCGAAVDEVAVDDEYDRVDFEAAGESNNFDSDAPSDVVVDDDVIPSPPSPPLPPVPVATVVVELPVPNELKRSPNDDIRSPPRLPSPISPRPPDDVVVVGLKRDELEGATVEAEAAVAEELEVPFVFVIEEEE